MNLVEIFLSFLEGMALIASPCILPMLPLILSTSVESGHRRPFGVITGFVLSFSIFALVSRELVAVFHFNLDYIKYVSLVLLGGFGFLMLSEKLSAKFSGIASSIAVTGARLSSTKKDGYLSGVLIGSLIGLIWTPCAGPILAVALVQIIRQQSNLTAVFLVLSFAIGAGVPMLIISLTGRKLMSKIKVLATHSGAIRKAMGVLILLAVAFIASGINIQTIFSNSTASQNSSVSSSQSKILQNGLSTPYPAPDFALSNVWLNTKNNQPLSMESLKGKVVLVDFWTYSCINCIRTLPYIKGWYKKYQDKGLVIVGVHAPEFEFEKNKDNVIKAIADDGIKYPVAMDNRLDTWINYNNQYWPAHYLIDKSGNVVYTSFGEGEYQVTENNIRVLLGLSLEDSNEDISSSGSFMQTRETYLGYQRASNFYAPQNIRSDISNTYSMPAKLPKNNWALSGKWLFQEQCVVSQEANAKLQLNFTAKYVYLVLGSSTGQDINLRLKLNGKPITIESGKDAHNGVVTVKGNRLYELIKQDEEKNSLLEIEASDSGLEAYAFTFG